MYTHLANGDFNEKNINKEDVIGRIDFEIGVGQEWILFTRSELTDRQYSLIAHTLKHTK